MKTKLYDVSDAKNGIHVFPQESENGNYCAASDVEKLETLTQELVDVVNSCKESLEKVLNRAKSAGFAPKEE
jgi:hypothetical protein